MAKLTLSDRECEIDELPRICMKCGVPSTHYESRKMKWNPAWVGPVGLLAFFIAGILGLVVYYAMINSTRKTMRLTTTFCDEHRNYWWHQKFYGSLLPLGGLVGMILGGISAAIIGSQPRFAGQDEIVVAAIVSGVAMFFIFLFIGVFTTRKAIKPTFIDEYEITLNKLHIEYVESVKDQRAERRERREAKRLAEQSQERPKARPVIEEYNEPEDEPFDAQRRRDWGDE